MFRGIVITIGVATLFRSRWLLLLGIFVGAGIYFLLKKCLRRSLLWYVLGVFLAWCALFVWFTSFQGRKKIPLSGVLSGLVVDQRSSDTRVVRLPEGEVLLRSKRALSPGEQISFSPYLVAASVPEMSWSRITPPSFFVDEFSFDRRLATKSYLAWGSVSQGQVRVVGSSPLLFFQKIRKQYKEFIARTFGISPTAALVLGLTTGDRSGFSRQIYTSFVESGLVHLLAVSGSNIVYVSLLLGVVLFWIPFYIRISVVGCCLIVYGMFCGADSSVVRAISMGILGLVATFSGRRLEVFRLLQITAGGMLLRNPLILWYDLGFLLSFCAVLGILFAIEWYDLLIEGKTHWFHGLVKGWLLPTLGATLGVFPVLVLWMGTVSLSSVLINFFVVPLVPVFLLLCFPVLLFGGGLFLISLLNRMSVSLIDLAAWGSTQGMFFEVLPGTSRLLVVCLFFLVLGQWREFTYGSNTRHCELGLPDTSRVDRMTVIK